MAVEFVVRCRLPGMRLRELRRFAQAALLHLGEVDHDLVVSFLSDQEIRRLNRLYRGKDRPTDVLAFPAREGPHMPGTEKVLGDVLIGVRVAQRQASNRGHSLAEELRVLLTHGLLHLLGYDHERSLAEARRMRRMERRILTICDVASRQRKPGSHGL